MNYIIALYGMQTKRRSHPDDYIGRDCGETLIFN